jgi:coproporphyrinogen III oxidase
MKRRDLIQEGFQKLQEDIIAALEAEDGKGKFGTEIWERPGGGGGKTRLLKSGNVIEKGGVNFSAVYGKTPDVIKSAFGIEAEDFFASGVSIVIHPENPWVPIIHMNVRYFELSNGDAWFGGGIDLTPAYVIHEDGLQFHQALKDVCDRFDPSWYARYKENADCYFTIRHRQESRGIGGIFYDRINARKDEDFGKLWNFSLAVGYTFAPAYVRLMAAYKNKPYSEKEKFWQLHRRSRYVEFNLVYDAGTKFGLDTNGRTESILMSMPPMACWESNFVPEEGSEEARSQAYFSHPVTWI